MARRWVAVAAAVMLLAPGCSRAEDTVQDDAEAFAAALEKGSLQRLTFAEGTPQQARTWWNRVREGMGRSDLAVHVTSVEEPEDDRAGATLRHTWTLEGVAKAKWTYETIVRFVRRGDTWAIDLSPEAVVPGLAKGERLDLTAITPERGDIVGAGGEPLVTERPVVRFGIDKTLVDASRAAASARALAELVDIDAQEFAERVDAAGDKAFVEAIVLRKDDVTPDIGGSYDSIEGARGIADAMPLAPTREFARPILGTVGPVTAEMIEERRARSQTRFAMRDNGDGTHSGTFKIPDLHAAILKKALQGLAAPRRVGESRVDPETGRKKAYTELLGQAFCELMEKYPADRLPSAGGNNATIVVTVDYEHLVRGIGAAILCDGTRISAAEARRLLCGAGIIPMVLGGDSVPLDVGRERRFHDRYQRLAMARRDGGCCAESCDRPPAWAEGHHDWLWSEGGPTDVAHGKLFCGHHHHLVHDDQYVKTRLPKGKVRFARRQ